jgi:hypothetical protein
LTCLLARARLELSPTHRHDVQEQPMDPTQQPPIISWTRRLEEASALDRVAHLMAPKIRSTFGTGSRGAALRGEWLGHALHPLLTDVVIGSWTSATVLDVVGGRASRTASQRLIATGLLAAGPTAWTGWAEWSVTGTREQRVGLVHAVTNGVAIGAYAASWNARRKGRHYQGVGLALAGAAVSGVGAYLGGHLAIARKVGSRHPAFDGAPTGLVASGLG